LDYCLLIVSTSPRIYSTLVDTYGVSNVYILSAGWGIVKSSFRLPKYDITFSKAKNVASFKRRSHRDSYADFCHLKDGIEPAIFFGGKDYLPLLRSLMRNQKRRKIAYFRAAQAEKTKIVDGWEMRAFVTPKLTNWHYDAARELITGRLKIG
jgi:hypothetical protein